MIYFVYQSALFTFLLFFTQKRIEKREVSFPVAWNLALLLMIFGFLGARLFHIFYEDLDWYRQDWIRVFKFWEGGFVFFGGAACAALACWVYLQRKGESFLEWADFYAPIFALGYGLGRVGCFLTGCCYGTYCDAFWAVDGRHPTQLYAAFTELALFVFLILQEKKRLILGRTFALWLIGHGLGRLFMETYRADFRGFILFGLSISSWVSLILFAAGLALLITPKARKRHLRN